MFETLPGLVTGVHCYLLECGGVALRQKFRDGSLNSEIQIHHDPDQAPCEACMAMDGSWEDRIVDEMVVYDSKFQVG